MVGALVVIAAMTIATMRKAALLHKLILTEPSRVHYLLLL